MTTLITEHTSPERLYLETKWAAILPFGKTVDLLRDVLPMSEKLNATSVRNSEKWNFLPLKIKVKKRS